MDAEQLIARRELLISQKNELQAQIYGYEGAIQDCDYWIKQLKTNNDTGEAD